MDQDMKESMMGALETVVDPELGVDIVNLGLVYDVTVTEDGFAVVTMTLTSMGCPMGPQIVEMVKNSLYELPEVEEVDVKIVWTPVWSKEHMSRYAKMALVVR